jgi:DNA-binding beta-propeller fold protein YncE
MRTWAIVVRLLLLGVVAWLGDGRALEGSEDPVVGEPGINRVVVPTHQVLTPAGRLVAFPGRPTDLALLPDRRTLVVKNQNDLILLDITSKEILQVLPLPSGGHAVAGLAVADEGLTIYTSEAAKNVLVARRKSDQDFFEWSEPWTLPKPPVKGDPAPTGLALSAAGRTLLVLSGRGNALYRFDRATGEIVGEPIAVGVAPFGVAVYSESKVYVSNWGGEPPKEIEPQSKSSGTPTRIDPRTGAAASGSVSVVDLEAGRTVKSIATGLHPCGLALSPDRKFLYVACANSDRVDVIAMATDAVVESITVRPEDRLPFGSGPNALAVAPEGDRLYVTNGTNNAVAVIELGSLASSSARGASRTIGFIPTGWYPGAVVIRPRDPNRLGLSGELLIVANIKGQGSRASQSQRVFHVHDYEGSVSIIAVPDSKTLAAQTRQVAENNRQALALSGLAPPRPNIPPRPVPERHGEPSLIKHVIYIIKENRTYDQVFGDLPQGNGDAKLVLFGQNVTPNQHALARRFVLLDNYYCSGALSADGHAWSVEGYVTDYLERQFGQFVRSYPFNGDDPLAYAPTGFLWDNALAHGVTFRDYGEFTRAEIHPRNSTWTNIFTDYQRGTSRVRIRAHPTVKSLIPYYCPTYVGFPGTVPDVYRAREFLKEFHEFEQKQELPRLIVMLLPNDHTEGTRPDFPTPEAMMADNDLALGRVVAAVTRSRFWPTTAIFVTEDDPQDGFDHVDGHRTVGQVISPYTRRRFVDHTFYTQIGMLKTIELILGLPPMNQLDLAAAPLRGCFQDERDTRPFRVRASQIPLNTMNPDLSQLTGPRRYWAQKSLELKLDDVDEADEETLNRILWHAVKGYDTPYPKVAQVDKDDDD